MNINWDKTAKLHGWDIDRTKAYFTRFTGSEKEIVATCIECGEDRIIKLCNGPGDRCNTCANTKNMRDFYDNGGIHPRGMLGKSHTNESKDRISDGVKKAFGDDPTIIEKIRCSSTGRIHTSETKELMTKSAVEAWKDQDRIDEHTKRSIKFWSIIENRERLSAEHQGIPYEEWMGFSQNDWRDWNRAVYINEPFAGCHRHHMTETIVAHIPSELHSHIKHTLKTGYNMGEMNMLALQFINGGL